MLLPKQVATGFAVQVHDRKTKNMLDDIDDGQNVAQQCVPEKHWDNNAADLVGGRAKN